MPVPQYDELFNPTLRAIKKLGGSASIREMEDEVTNSLNLSEAEIAERHDARRTKLEYRLAWARTYLKAYGILDNSVRGVWVFTAKGKDVDTVDPAHVVRTVRGQQNSRRQKRSGGNLAPATSSDAPEISGGILEQSWRDDLLATLLRLSPAAFERLCQRLLRESGFVEVKVTGRSGDGGIDGTGVVRLGGLLGFPILFQCKRYQGAVGPNTIRDFRGAMVGRADRGLVITTGTFTRDAKAEATRDGAPPIDLVDGEQLLDKLKELQLGVTIQMIEEVSVVPSWFADL